MTASFAGSTLKAFGAALHILSGNADDLVQEYIMRALSIRQPYAEEILRGIKPIEYRSRRTFVIGERFYIYAAKLPGDLRRFKAIGCVPGELPTGLLIGTAVISHCTATGSKFQWHLRDVRRLARPIKPAGRPQPAWFHPF